MIVVLFSIVVLPPVVVSAALKLHSTKLLMTKYKGEREQKLNDTKKSRINWSLNNTPNSLTFTLGVELVTVKAIKMAAHEQKKCH